MTFDDLACYAPSFMTFCNPFYIRFSDQDYESYPIIAYSSDGKFFGFHLNMNSGRFRYSFHEFADVSQTILLALFRCKYPGFLDTLFPKES